MLPNSLFVSAIQLIGDHAVSGGGHADVWKGVTHISMLTVVLTNCQHFQEYTADKQLR